VKTLLDCLPWRRKAAATNSGTGHEATGCAPDPAHHAVTIEANANACEAARDLVGQRFLAREAPPLPLPDCDVSECPCRYRHYQDRRQGTRRSEDEGGVNTPIEGAERREQARRRAADEELQADPGESYFEYTARHRAVTPDPEQD